ncbi:Regulator of chromosome condensation 1/beta-lactamase-inhibitor protein II [Arabidopsis suecica]|uniref:Regulator of chromosome condensation 1/beta-lactamase-inhibitor protein II n=1 Tax=Arabidopsis suecica TaxID=45249 RepID=A0A8T2B605_ARASU|nr:Regulator of chromosome condensation 1/beta-lactamase-inhibitor protein II [Arabidopsis suecica]
MSREIKLVKLTNPSPGISPYMKLDEISSVTRELILRTGLRMLELTEPEKTRECRFRSITSLVGERVLHLTSCRLQQSEFGLHVSKPSKQVLELKKGLYVVLWARERYLWNEEDEEHKDTREKTWLQHFSQSYCFLPVTGSSLHSLHGKTVVSISAGKYWASAVTSTGEVYMWDGKNVKDMPPSLSRLPSSSHNNFLLFSSSM